MLYDLQIGSSRIAANSSDRVSLETDICSDRVSLETAFEPSGFVVILKVCNRVVVQLYVSRVKKLFIYRQTDSSYRDYLHPFYFL